MKKLKAFTLVELLVILAVISVLFIGYISKADFATYKAKDAGILTDFHSYELAINTVTREQGDTSNFNTTEDFIESLNKNLDKKLRFTLNEPYFSSNLNPYSYKYELKFNNVDNTIEIYSPKGPASSSLFAFGAGSIESEAYVGLIGTYMYSAVDPKDQYVLSISKFNKTISKQESSIGSEEAEKEYTLQFNAETYQKDYLLGDAFDVSSLEIYKSYIDGSKQQILDFVVENGSNLNITQTSVRITYGINSLEIPISVTINTLPIGTKYTSGNYEYSYGQTFNPVTLAWTNSSLAGWGIGIIDMSQTSYSAPLEVINGAPVVSYSQMFRKYSNSSLTLVGDWSNKYVTNTNQMFYDTAAKTIEFGTFDTSNVQNMRSMFYGCQATNLNLNSFKTSNVTDMAGMFCMSTCASVNVSSFDTRNVSNMDNMFNGSKFTTLDLSSFEVQSATLLNDTFRSSSITTVYVKTATEKSKFTTSTNKPAGLTFIVK